MEESKYYFSPVFVSVGYILFISLTLCLFKFNIFCKEEKKKVPPTSNSWFFLGHTLLWFYYMAKLDPLSFFNKYIIPYGEIVTCNLFGRRTVVSVDPEFNKFVLHNEGRLFKASYFKSLHDMMGKYSMLSVTGDLHRQLHGSAVNLLNNEKLRINFIPALQLVFNQTITKWGERREIVLQPECKRLVFNVMAKHLLNVSEDRETDELYSLLTDLINGVVSVPIEMLNCAYAKGLRARRILGANFYKLMEERKINPRADLLSKLVNEENLPKEIVADFIFILLVASYETASRTMVIAIHFLSHSKKALNQLREEHERIQNDIGDKMLQWEDYKKMKFTQCVINESLRLSSIAVGIVRETTQDVTVKGYVIPKGWGVMTFFYAVHMNGKVYKEPLKFHPWRWQDNEKQELLWKNYDMQFSPFGGGRRLCPGADLARMTISFFLHYFITKFRWEIVGEGRITFFPIPHMEGGLPIRLFPKSSTSIV